MVLQQQHRQPPCLGQRQQRRQSPRFVQQLGLRMSKEELRQLQLKPPPPVQPIVTLHRFFGSMTPPAVMSGHMRSSPRLPSGLIAAGPYFRAERARVKQALPPLGPPGAGHPGMPCGGDSAWLHVLGARAHAHAARHGLRSRSPRRRQDLTAAAGGSSVRHLGGDVPPLAGWRRERVHGERPDGPLTFTA